jgi:adenylate kinase family enzyme
MSETKIVVLRGPSGSGKTTTAKSLFEKVSARTVLIEQDHYRFIFKPAGGGSKPNSAAIHKMIKSDVLIALQEGYNVILEGILGPKSYDDVLDDIFRQHLGENYVYYFDMSFEETVRRHATRNSDFGPEDMRNWYPASYRSSQHPERIIPESSILEETVSKILSETGL